MDDEIALLAAVVGALTAAIWLVLQYFSVTEMSCEALSVTPSQDEQSQAAFQGSALQPLEEVPHHELQGTTQCPKSVINCKNFYLTTENQKRITEGSGSMSDNAHGHGLQVIQKDSDIYITTGLFEDVSNCVKTKHHVTIIGSAGAGKTAMAYHLLREYERSGYNIILARHPEQLKRYRIPNAPTIVLVNDIFGRSVFSPTLFHEWKEELEELEPILGYGSKYTSNFKLVCTCRNYIWSEAVTCLGIFSKTIFSENTIIDITRGLQFEERMDILNVHQKKYGLETMDEDVMKSVCCLESPHGFPHTCFLFFQMPQFHDRVMNFFKSPLPCLLESIQELARSDIKKYIVLILVLLHDGELDIRSLTIDNPKLSYIITRFPSVSFQELLQEIGTISSYLCSSFLKEKKNVLMFHHPTIHDTVAYVLGKHYPQFIVQNCSVEFLFERVRISVCDDGFRSLEDTHFFHIVLPYGLWSSLSARFAKEIKQKNFPLICSHQAMSKPDFVRQCFAILKDESLDIVHAVDQVFKRSVLTWAMWNKSHILCDYLVSNYPFGEEAKLKALVCCCSSGNITCLSLLLQHVSQTKLLNYKTKREQYEYIVSDKSGKFITKRVHKGFSRDSLILLACECGHSSVVDCLLMVGFSIHDVNDRGDTTLHKCCMGDNALLVPYLLENGCEVLARNKEKNIPLHIAAENNNCDHVHELLHFKDRNHSRLAQISARNNEFETPLLVACKNGHVKMATLLLRYGADISARNRQGYSSVSLATEAGHQDLVRVLMEYKKINDGDEPKIKSEGHHTHSNNIQQVKSVEKHKLQGQKNEQIMEGYKFHGPDNNDNTPLFLACQNNNLIIAANLIPVVEDINIKDKHGDTPLTIACKHDNTEMAMLLLENGALVNATNGAQLTPLMFACMNGNRNIAKKLVSLNADTSACSQEGDTPLMLACRNGNSDIVSELVSKTKDLDAQNNIGFTALSYTCKYGHFKIMKLLLNRNAQVGIRDTTGNTALMVACDNGHIRIIDLLVTSGASVNTTNAEGDSSLLIACRKGYFNIVKTLIQKGAMSYPNKKGETPLLCAVESGRWEMISTLIGLETDSSVLSKCLHYVCSNNNEKALRKLVSRNVDLDMRDDDGNTALMLACRSGAPDIVLTLLSAGSDTTAVNERQETALMIACHCEHTSVAEELINDHADVNAQNIDGETALLMSCKTGNTKIIQILLDAKAFLNLCCNNGNTALIVASKGGHTKAVETLLSQKVNINYQNRHGDTALIVSCREGHSDVTDLLLSFDAHASIRNKDGDTALLTATKHNNIASVTMLLEYGVDVNIRDNSGDTALIWACRKGFDVILESFILHNADVSVSTKDDQSPLLLAALSGNVKCLELVISAVKEWDQDCRNIFLAICETGFTHMVQVMLPWSSSRTVYDVDGNTPLICASRGGHSHIVDILLKNECCVNERNTEGDTAILLACRGRHLSVVDILLSHGADVTAKNNKDETAILTAFASQCKTLWSLVFSQCHGESVQMAAWQDLLFAACQDGNLCVMRDLVSRGMSVNIQDIHGNSVLIYATKMELFSIVSWLTENGANINHSNHEGVTALWYACRKGNGNMVEYLLSKGAGVACTSPETNPLVIACERNHSSVIKQLLKKDPLNIKCTEALLLACENSYGDIVNVILQNTTLQSDFKDYDDTPLTVAVRYGNLTITKTLLSHNVDINQKNRHGECPLILACTNNHVAIVEVLLKHHADIWATDSDGNSALNIACKTNNQPLIAVITESLSYLNDEDGTVNTFINMRNHDGTTALIEATKMKDNLFNGLISATKMYQNFDLQDRNGDTALMNACRSGSDGLVKQLLSVNADVSILNQDGESALSLACKEGHVPVVNLLLQASAEPNVVSFDGCSPLHWACKTNNITMANLLLRYKLKIDIKDNDGMTPLMVSCQASNNDLVQLLLKHHADMFLTDNHGHGVMWHAVSSGSLEVWQTLKCWFHDKNALSEYINYHGNAYLIQACKQGRFDIVMALVDYGMDVSASGCSNYTPLTAASEYGQTNIVTYLISNNAIVNMCNNRGYTPLMLACRGSREDVVSVLLHHKANVKSKTTNGTTALMLASMQTSVEIIKKLLVYGSDIDACDAQGEPALMKACRHGHLATACMLLKHHANISISNRYGETPFSVSSNYPDLLKELTKVKEISDLFAACETGNLSRIKIILSNDSIRDTAIDGRNKRGHSPLMTVCKAGHKHLARHLLNLKADVNQTDTNGNTALHFACRNGHEGVSTMLIKHGIDTDLKNKDGHTAYMVAKHEGKEKIVDELLLPIVKNEETWFSVSRQGNLEVIKELFSEGHAINQTNQFGETPIMLALGNRNILATHFFLSQHASLGMRTIFGDTVLMYACKGGNVDLVNHLLTIYDHSKDVTCINKANNKGITPLMIGSMYGRIDIVMLLLKRGASANAVDDLGNTSLLYSCRYGYAKVTRLLLKRSKNIQHFNRSRNRPLHEACIGGHLDLVKLLLSHPTDVNSKNAEGDTALILACRKGLSDIAVTLLKFRADINLPNNMGFTPLMEACRFGQQKTVHILLENNADVNIRNKYGSTFAQLATENGYRYFTESYPETDEDIYDEIDDPDVLPESLPKAISDNYTKSNLGSSVSSNTARSVGENASDETRLIIACESGNRSHVTRLLSMGVNVNVTDEDGNTPLLIVCRTGQKSIVQDLLNHGAEANFGNKYGGTPLIIACQYDHKDIVELLIEKDANVNEKTRLGYTALMWTSVNGSEALTRCLLSNEAEVNVSNDFGYTALMMAKSRGHSNIVDLLSPHTKHKDQAITACVRGDKLMLLELIGKIDIDVRNSCNATLLMIACSYGHHEIVNVLITNGASIDQRNSAQETALMLACRGGWITVVTQLLLHRAVVNLQNEKGETELIIASQGGHLKVVQLLLEHGADSSITSKCGENPASTARQRGYERLAKLLSPKKRLGRW